MTHNEISIFIACFPAFSTLDAISRCPAQCVKTPIFVSKLNFYTTLLGQPIWYFIPKFKIFHWFLLEISCPKSKFRPQNFFSNFQFTRKNLNFSAKNSQFWHENLGCSFPKHFHQLEFLEQNWSFDTLWWCLKRKMTFSFGRVYFKWLITKLVLLTFFWQYSTLSA